MFKINYELTDTFGDRLQGNYCWVKRGAVNVKKLTNRAIVAKVKKALGITARHAGVIDNCDSMIVYFPNACGIVLFIDYLGV